MLGVLTAQSADEPAPLAPTDPHPVHVATSPTRELTSEELPSLPIHTASPVASLTQLPGVASELREPLAVRHDQLAEAQLESGLHCGADRREIAVLDQGVELASLGRGELDEICAGRARVPKEAAHGLRPVGQASVEAVLL